MGANQSHLHLPVMLVGRDPASTPKESKKLNVETTVSCEESARRGKVCGMKRQYRHCTTRRCSARKIKRVHGNGGHFAGQAHLPSTVKH